MDRQEILNRLMAFPYDRDEYWVITGSAMVMYGIKEHAGDIDLGCSVKMADLLESDGYLYAQPERDGEAMDPAYQRFLPGLGLTKTMLLPHYQENKDDILDGLRVYEDIAFSDSYGNVFYAIPDGTYLLIEGGKEELRGEAYRISNGNMLQVSKANDIVRL